MCYTSYVCWTILFRQWWGPEASPGPITRQHSLLIIQIILAWAVEPTVGNQRVKQMTKMIFLLCYLWEEWMRGKNVKYLMFHFPFYVLRPHLLALPLQSQVLLLFCFSISPRLSCSPKCSKLQNDLHILNPNFVR